MPAVPKPTYADFLVGVYEDSPTFDRRCHRIMRTWVNGDRRLNVPAVGRGMAIELFREMIVKPLLDGVRDAEGRASLERWFELRIPGWASRAYRSRKAG